MRCFAQPTILGAVRLRMVPTFFCLYAFFSALACLFLHFRSTPLKDPSLSLCLCLSVSVSLSLSLSLSVRARTRARVCLSSLFSLLSSLSFLSSLALSMGAVVSSRGAPLLPTAGPTEVAFHQLCAPEQSQRREAEQQRARHRETGRHRDKPSVEVGEGGTPEKAARRGVVHSPVFERPQDPQCSTEASPSKETKAAAETATATGTDTRTEKRPLALVLPPVLADRPCDIDAMPQERRQLFANVPCCGGRGCPQCSLMSLGFR